MPTLFSILVAGGLCLITEFIASNAHASGRLSFFGAVVMPTCEAVVATQDLHGGSSQRSCALPGESVGTAALSPRTFTLEVTRLHGSVDNKMLKYFDTYVRAARADGVDPLLVTQTYQ